MKIGLRAGHSPNCRGARKLRDEYDSMIQLYNYTRDLLVRHGHTVVDCNSNANTQGAELREGASKANNANVDLFISLHMNASNGNGQGTEAWVHSRNGGAFPTAQRLVNNFASLGLKNRGVKYDFDDGDLDYYEMRGVKASNIIFETLFCDNKHDVEEIWSPTPYEHMARLIANAIDPNISIVAPKPPEKKYQVRIYSFLTKEDAENCKKKIDEIGWHCKVEEI